MAQEGSRGVTVKDVAAQDFEAAGIASNLGERLSDVSGALGLVIDKAEKEDDQTEAALRQAAAVARAVQQAGMQQARGEHGAAAAPARAKRG